MDNKSTKKPELIFRDLHVDDRGYVYGAFDNLDKSGIKRTYVVENFARGMVRAWHGHKKADTYIHVIRGSAKVAAVKIGDANDYLVQTMSYKKPAVFYVPAGYYNGTMSLEDNTVFLIYSTITLDECAVDDFREKWDAFPTDIWNVGKR